MKRIYTYILALVILNSCTSDFLDVSPTTSIPESEFYNSEDRIMQGLMAAYAPLKWPDYAFGQYNPLQFISDIMSDDVLVGGANANDSEYMHRMRAFNATPVYVCDALWSVFYSGVNRSNIVINKIDGVPDLSESKKDRILAEARALRAYYYFWLWKLWGNVPFYTENPSTPPYLIEQIGADELYSKIIEDLDFALENDRLPANLPDNELGRFTKSAVQMLKANTVMYQRDNSRYVDVLTDMREIIISRQFDLVDDFALIWEDEGEWNEESIFEINYSDELGERWYGDGLVAGGSAYPLTIGINNVKNTRFNTGWGYEPVEPELYELYDNIDQRKDGGILNFAKLKMSSPTASYDPRYQDTGLFNLKYLPRVGGNDLCTGDKERNYRNNYRVYRFSETLLIASELIVRTGGPQSEADEYLNRVRKRAYRGSGSYEKTATLENLLLENRLEFALEGHRFWDLVRFGEAENVLGNRGYTSSKKHLPIPLSEIDKAQNTLKQNPY